jgi:uroporphyrin-III C-methyltransferase
MSMGNLFAISEALRAAGMSGETAVAVVTDATTPRQRVLITSLARAADDVAVAGLKAPAIIAIGSIVDVRKALVAHAIGPLGAHP